MFHVFAVWLRAAMSPLPNREHGQGLVEYAFILVLVALIVIVILAVVGLAVRDGLYDNIINNI